jgi:threonine dehydratase
VRSYKLRGAYNLIMQLGEDELRNGVVCSSAGNHAQGFALACRSMKVHGRVYVPAKTPKQKRDRIRYHGGDYIELIVGGATYDDAAAAAREDLAAQRKRVADQQYLHQCNDRAMGLLDLMLSTERHEPG